jgi:subtilisin-like proprotein convertase family protein
VKVNEDGVRDQFFPDVSLSLDGEKIMFSYYSRSHDPDNLLFHRRGRIGTMNTSTGAIALNRSFQLGPDTPIAIAQDPVINPTYMGDYDDTDSTNTLHHTVWSDNRDGNSFHEHQPDVFYARVMASANNADVSVTVTPTPASIDQGDSTTLTVEASAAGGTARDVYINLPRAAGLEYDSASGNCDLIDGVVGCSLGNIAAGASRTRTVQALGTTPGSRTPKAGVTTTSRDTNLANNSDTATVTVSSVPTVTQTFSSGNLATPIPDVATVNVPVTVNTGPGTSTVFDVDAYVRLNHTYDADLDISLVAPGGSPIVELSSANGGSGDNYGSGANDCSGTATVFNDSAATPITAGVAPFAGSFSPEEPLTGVFGEPTDGTWNLRVADTAVADTGTIGCVRLRIRHPS